MEKGKNKVRRKKNIIYKTEYKFNVKILNKL